MKKGWLQKLGAAFVTCVILFTFVACGSASYDEGLSQATSDGYYYSNSKSESWDVAMEEYAEDEAFGMNGGSAESVTQPVDPNRKLIKTANVSVETKEFDRLLGLLQERVVSLGGYIESMESYNGSIYSDSRSIRHASIIARIPAENLSVFLSCVEENGNITRRNESVEDITLTYVDIESRKEMLRTEEKRLLAYLEEAENIEEIISIEERLSEVRYEVESIESRLRTFDNKVNYSTANIDISEVEIYTPPETKPESVWEHMKNGFVSNLLNVLCAIRDFFVGFVIVLPELVLLAIIGFVIFLIVRAILRKNKKKAQARLEQERQEAEAAAQAYQQYGAQMYQQYDPVTGQTFQTLAAPAGENVQQTNQETEANE